MRGAWKRAALRRMQSNPTFAICSPGSGTSTPRTASRSASSCGGRAASERSSSSAGCELASLPSARGEHVDHPGEKQQPAHPGGYRSVAPVAYLVAKRPCAEHVDTAAPAVPLESREVDARDFACLAMA